MKKLLLSLAAVLFGVGAMADDTKTTIDLTNPEALGYETPANSASVAVDTIKVGNVTIVATSASSSGVIFWGTKTGVEVRMYANDKLTFTSTDPYIKSITFSGSNLGTSYLDGITATGKWEGMQESVVITGLKTKAQITSIVVTTGDADEDYVEMPSFSYTSGANFPRKAIPAIGLEAAEGTTVYYTTDKSEPTTSSTQYTAAFVPTIADTINSFTVKAIAVDGSNNKSSVASAIYYLIDDEYTVAELIEAAPTTAAAIKLNNALITYINGKYVYMRDGSGVSILLYAESFANAFVVGDVLNGYLVAKYAANNGSNQVTDYIYSLYCTEISEQDATVTPVSVAVADVNNYKEDLITISGYLKISGTSYYVVANATDEASAGVQLYDAFKLGYDLSTATEGTEISVTGIYQYYKSTTPEIKPTVEPVLGASTAISTIAAPATESEQAYNLAGQKVDSSYKGIVVKGGKKFIQK